MDQTYGKLLILARKFEQLATNQSYVYSKLSEHLAKQIKDESSLREVFKLSHDVGNLVKRACSDSRKKAHLIASELPKLVFSLSDPLVQVMSEENETAFSFLIDMWTYSS